MIIVEYTPKPYSNYSGPYIMHFSAGYFSFGGLGFEV